MVEVSGKEVMPEIVQLKVLDLFSGILGGFSLGLERTGGFKTVAFCEIEEFPRKVLAKHWPDVPCYHDIRELTGDRLRADGIAVDVICGGFPCQDISKAGRGAGIDGERSGLWADYARLIGELRPKYVVVENVSALLNRGLDRVLGDLATLGYDAEWHCIPAAAVGAPHIRDRIWIVAYPHRPDDRRGPHVGAVRRGKGESADHAEGTNGERDWRGLGDCRQAPDVPNADQAGRSEISWGETFARRGWLGAIGDTSRWDAEPAVGRMVDGLPRELARWRKRSIEALGNAVVPQVVELLGRAILQSMVAA